jgi:hypothetical protein
MKLSLGSKVAARGATRMTVPGTELIEAYEVNGINIAG